jgi:hypothetical protein
MNERLSKGTTFRRSSKSVPLSLLTNQFLPPSAFPQMSGARDSTQVAVGAQPASNAANATARETTPLLRSDTQQQQPVRIHHALAYCYWRCEHR